MELHAGWKIFTMVKEANFRKNSASEMNLGKFSVARATEVFVAIFD